jgi:predicted membrane protein DUF2142
MAKEEKIFSTGVMLTFTLVCIANVLLLPPYEGFDETAHYSYISILSDRSEVPDFRRTPLDKTVEEDRQGLPRPYNSIPPFEKNGGITYSEFFNGGDPLTRAAAARKLWQEPQTAAWYTPGPGTNWQGQHPPLYYLLMLLPYRLARAWPPGLRLLFLRLFSVALACGSLVFWLKAVKFSQCPEVRRLLLLTGLVITFFPSLWYDLARLGNDSLAALLFAASFYFLLSTTVNQHNRLGDFVGLAVTLGLGLLTKLFFLPLTIGAIFVSLRSMLGDGHLDLRAVLSRTGVLVVVPLLLAGWWFAFCYVRYGVAVTSHETYLFQHIVDPPGNHLTGEQFLIEMMRG